MVKELFRFLRQPELQSPSLVVGWSGDAGKLGLKVVDYLNQKLGGQSFNEIELIDFFQLGGVTVEDNVIQFPEAKFSICQRNNLVIFKSEHPYYEYYKFLNSVLDMAEYHCRVNELYTIGGMISLSAHTVPRELISTVNSPEMKKCLSKYDLRVGGDYQTPPDQRPTLNSFLLWLAKKRDIPGVTLWVPIPFYLVTVGDPMAQKKLLEFFDARFDLKIDFSDLDIKIKNQNEKMTQIRTRLPEIDDYIRRLESNISLSEEENEKLVKEIEELFNN